MLRGFDEQPPRMAVAGLGDAALAASLVAGIFRGHETEIGHELARMVEAPGAAEFADQHHGADQRKAAQTHHGFDDGLLRPAFQQAVHLIFQSRDAFPGRGDRGEGVLEHHALRGMRHRRPAPPPRPSKQLLIPIIRGGKTKPNQSH